MCTAMIVKLAPNQNIFSRSYAISVTNVTFFDVMSVSTGIRLRMILCVVEPRAGENADLSLWSQDSTSLLFPTVPSLAFHCGKGEKDCSFQRSHGCCGTLWSHSLCHGCVGGGRG